MFQPIRIAKWLLHTWASAWVLQRLLPVGRLVGSDLHSGRNGQPGTNNYAMT